MVSAISAKQLERLQDKARALVRTIPALSKPLICLSWQEWCIVPYDRARRGLEASALSIAKTAVDVISEVAPLIQGLGGRSSEGWEIGDVGAFWDTRRIKRGEYVLACFIEWRAAVPPTWDWAAASRYALFGDECPIYSKLGNPHDGEGLKPV